jgi:hypothetical protein
MPRQMLLLLGLTACRSEQNVGSDIIDYGAPNPAELSTPIQLDRIVQTTIPAIDVLFVVDNSCSMSEEQLSLGGNFSAMLSWFVGSGLDYHVGVVSTDMNDPAHGGRLRVISDRRWIDPATEDPEALFASMVQMGTGGFYAEKGRAAAWSAIELLASEDNLGFVRADAGMHITVVSDENDDSGDSPITQGEWIDYLQDFRVGARMVTFSSIVGPLTGCPYIGSPGTEYMAVTSAVGGVTWPICSEDWTRVLDELGFVAVGLTREFFLSHLPVLSTLQVRVDAQGNVLEFTPADYTYSETRNSITFLEYAPQPLEVVELEYQVLSSVFETEPPADPPTPE